MMIQSQILQTLRAPESQARLAHIMAHEALDSRAAVGRRVCAEFGFVDARGSAQLAGCLKALNRLEGAGRIVLPAPRRRGCAPSPRCLDEPVAAATGVPGTVEAVDEFRWQLINRMECFVHAWIERKFDLDERARPLRPGEGVPARPSVTVRVSPERNRGLDDDYGPSR